MATNSLRLRGTWIEAPLCRWVLGAGWAVLAAACAAGEGTGGPGGSSGTGNGSGTGGGTATPSNAVIGKFEASIHDGIVDVSGAVSDGPALPTLILGAPTATSGDCKVLPVVSPTCTPECARSTGAVCVAKDTCQNTPTVQDVGQVSVSGIRTVEGQLALTHVGTNMRYGTGESPRYAGAFNEGDVVTLTASGSSFASAFTVSAKAIAELKVTETTVHLAPQTPLALHWTPASQSDASRIAVVIDITHHGGTLAQIQCDTADTGALDIPASLISELMDFRYNGGNALTVTRRSSGKAAISAVGQVELIIDSQVQVAITIEGQTACDPDNPSACPQGQACQFFECVVHCDDKTPCSAGQCWRNKCVQ